MPPLSPDLSLPNAQLLSISRPGKAILKRKDYNETGLRLQIMWGIKSQDLRGPYQFLKGSPDLIAPEAIIAFSLMSLEVRVAGISKITGRFGSQVPD